MEKGEGKGEHLFSLWVLIELLAICMDCMVFLLLISVVVSECLLTDIAFDDCV